jgi:hypothetical protein
MAVKECVLSRRFVLQKDFSAEPVILFCFAERVPSSRLRIGRASVV